MIDYSSLVSQLAVFVLSVVGSVFLAWLRSHMMDQASAAVIAVAVTNALGAVRQATDAGIKSHPLQISMPDVSPSMAAGVQYVLDNATPELARFTGITPEVIASKINARIGSAKIETNLAVSSSSSSTVLTPMELTPHTQ